MTSRTDDRDRDATSQQTTAEGQRSLAQNLRLGIGVALVAALVLFFAQNFEDARISFLWFDWDMPLVIALLLSAVVGSLATWLFTTVRGRAARNRQEAMYDAAMRGKKG